MISFAFGGTLGLTRGPKPAFVQGRSHRPVVDVHPEDDSLQVLRLPFPGAHRSSLRPNSNLVERVFSVMRKINTTFRPRVTGCLSGVQNQWFLWMRLVAAVTRFDGVRPKCDSPF